MAGLAHLIGLVLDSKYRIERQLGAGGMGAVFLATHLGTKRQVALKVIVPQLTANAEFVARFQREAEAAGRLRHPNVVNVTDFGFARVETEQVAYLVMEYLDGQTLSELLRGGQRLPLEFVVEIAEQICLAIDKAHQHGIIHRDLKPDNIWLEPNGRGGYNVKVLDFGLAKLRDAAPPAAPPAAKAGDPISPEAPEEAPTFIDPPADPPDDPRRTQPIDASPTGRHESPATDPAGVLTRVGTIMGTPRYMSPEQCCGGGALGPASDLYSLGVIIYQMLAGETPFVGDTRALLRQHLKEAPPPLEKSRPDLPRSVTALVASALAKDPDARPAPISAFASALRTNAAGENALLRQAITLYSDRFSIFLPLAVVCFTPVLVAVAAFALLGVYPHWQTPPAIGAAALWFAVGLFIYNAMIGAVVTPLVAHALDAPLKSLPLGRVLAAMIPRLRAFVPVFLIAHRSFAVPFGLIAVYTFMPEALRREWRQSPIFWAALAAAVALFALLIRKDQQEGRWLHSPVALLEGVRGSEIRMRERVLVGRLAGSFGTGRVPPLLLTAMLGAAVLAMLLGGPVLQHLGRIEGIDGMISTLIVVGAILLNTLLSVLVSPLLAISIALFYLKARQAGGESLGVQ